MFWDKVDKLLKCNKVTNGEVPVSLIFTGCGIKTTPPKKTKISRKRLGIFCCVFHQLMSKYMSVRYINFIKIFHPQTKLWLCKMQSVILYVNNNWSVQLQEIDTVLIIIVKKTRHVDASITGLTLGVFLNVFNNNNNNNNNNNINSNSMFEMSTPMAPFCTSRAFCGMTVLRH